MMAPVQYPRPSRRPQMPARLKVMKDVKSVLVGDVREWSRNGLLLHSVDDLPAIEMLDGTRAWFQKGLLHRDGAPAYEDAEGRKSWWRHGKLLREEGPVDLKGGIRAWYFDGTLHREDGPAVEAMDGRREWWTRGELR